MKTNSEVTRTHEHVPTKKFSTLCHPSWEEQVDALNKVTDLITFDNLNKELVSPLGFKLISFNRLLGKGGVINPIYSLTVEPNSATKSTSKSTAASRSTSYWFLRVGNPHSWWQHIKTRWEIDILTLVSHHCGKTIPIPKVLRSSDDKNIEPLIGCEFILFERLEGLSLGDIMDYCKENKIDIPNKAKSRMFDQLCKVVTGLRGINININIDAKIEDNPMANVLTHGNYCVIGTINSKKNKFGGIRQDGPSIGPFYNIYDYFNCHFKSNIWQLRNNKEKNKLYNSKIVDKIEQSLMKFLKQEIEPLNKQIIKLKSKFDENTIPFQLCFLNHCDLNPSNIFVDCNCNCDNHNDNHNDNDKKENINIDINDNYKSDGESKLDDKYDLSRLRIKAILDWESSYVSPFADDILMSLPEYQRMWSYTNGYNIDWKTEIPTESKENENILKDAVSLPKITDYLNKYIDLKNKNDQQLCHEYDKIVKKLNEYKDVRQYSCDMVFYTVSWWTPFILKKDYKSLKLGVDKESKDGHDNLKKCLQKYNCWFD